MVLSALSLIAFVVGGLHAAPAVMTQRVPGWYVELSGAASALTPVGHAMIIVLLTLRRIDDPSVGRTD